MDAVTMVTGLFSRKRSWNPGQTRGIRSHCPHETLHPDLQLRSFQGLIKGCFASSIALAEPAACGLMPSKSGKCPTRGAWPTASHSYLPRKSSKLPVNVDRGEQKP